MALLDLPWKSEIDSKLESSKTYIAIIVPWSNFSIQFLSRTWHISFSTRTSKEIPVPFVKALTKLWTAMSTSSCEHDEGTQTAQFIVEKRGTRWPGWWKRNKEEVLSVSLSFINLATTNAGHIICVSQAEIVSAIKIIFGNRWSAIKILIASEFDLFPALCFKYVDDR